MAGQDFGSEQLNVMLVVREMYGLKQFGEAFRDLLVIQLHGLGYRTSIDDPDAWTRTPVKTGGVMYYECVLLYVDGVIFISDDPLRTMKYIHDKFKLKGYKI